MYQRVLIIEWCMVEFQNNLHSARPNFTLPWMKAGSEAIVRTHVGTSMYGSIHVRTMRCSDVHESGLGTFCPLLYCLFKYVCLYATRDIVLGCSGSLT